jgi:general L-amino acid transport system substrate-binding protein
MLASAAAGSWGQAPAMAPAASAIQAGLPANTSAVVKARGHVKCGVIGTSAGFSLPDSRGVMRGIDADVCRAVAAALFGDPGKVEFLPFTVAQRLTALQAGEVDLVAANLTWTLTREARSGLAFAAVHYYDGASFMVAKKSKVTTATRLAGASICVLTGSAEGVMQDYFALRKQKVKAVVFSEGEEMRKAFLAGRCDAIMSDASALANFRSSLAANADNYILLPEVVSKEPLGVAVRKGDGKWFDLVRWTFFAMVNAEELGITSKNIDDMLASPNPAIRRLVGIEGDLGASLGIDNKWAVNVIKGVGNYGEMWERNFAPTGVARGLNRLWNNGGLQISPPFR